MLHARSVLGALSLVAMALFATPATAQAADPDIERLTREVSELRSLVQTLQAQVGALTAGTTPAPSSPEGALDRALAEAEADAEADSGASADAGVASVSRSPVGLRLIDLSLDTLTSVGGSTASDAELLILQGGDHDPRQRGFNLQAVELSMLGAVDPYLTGEAHLVYFLDPDGESRFELEEAFATTQALPYDLQAEFGQMFTEFGRINPLHAHAWTFVDQPVILSRLFGEDGIRNPGARLSWLAPVPWFAELSFGSQNSKGETMVSFLANDEVIDERAIGGVPCADREVNGLGDLVWLGRLANGFDVGETWTFQAGASALLGPNCTGPEAVTQILGADFMAKWRPARHRRGWPFVKIQGEWLFRRYETDETANVYPTLRDWGGYAYAELGLRERWSLGLRGEYANGSGDGLIAREDDPYRQARYRLSPLLTFYQSEFARWRLQYNYDRSAFLSDPDAHSLWLVLEFAFGAHPAHKL